MIFSIPPLGPVQWLETLTVQRTLEELERMRDTLEDAVVMDERDNAPGRGHVLVRAAIKGRSIVTITIDEDDDDLNVEMRTAFDSSALHVDRRLLALIVPADAPERRRAEAAIALARRAFNDASVSELKPPQNAEVFQRIVKVSQARFGTEDEPQVLEVNHAVGNDPDAPVLPARIIGRDPDGLALDFATQPFVALSSTEGGGFTITVHPHSHILYAPAMDAMERLRVIAEDDAARAARRDGSA
jgi:hypothetical protein